MNKVENGTPTHEGPSLCVTCRSAQIIVGTRIDEEFVICDNLSSGHDRIRFKVVKCSKYSDKTRASLNSMQEIAWQLCSDKAGRQIGFMSPTERASKKYSILEPKWLDEDEVMA